jgi:membrane-associated phospholipid phosphatase
MKLLIVLARILSTVFRPVYYPTVGIIILLTSTYLILLPWSFRLAILSLVYVFTIALPAGATYLYRRIRKLSRYELRHRQKRWGPYIIHLVCYIACMQVMMALRLPRFMIGVIAASALIQCTCILINMKWKVSVHSAGSGGVIGALVAYSFIFSFNPVWWLCLAILVSGLVMTSRMLLRQHSLWQVLGGTAVGIICGYYGIIFM